MPPVIEARHADAIATQATGISGDKEVGTKTKELLVG